MLQQYWDADDLIGWNHTGPDDSLVTIWKQMTGLQQIWEVPEVQ